MSQPPADNPPNPSSRDLDTVQRWFQAVITHPDGVRAGADSDTAQGLIRAGRDELEKVIRRSTQLSAAERIGVYANAYYARLLEVLRNVFPVLTQTLGEDTFNSFAFGYLQQCPSSSYTLGRLADRFPDFLEATRPQDTRGKLMWPDFLVELARLEWHISEVFDGPGVEKIETVTPERLAAIPPDRFPSARLKPVICLRILAFRYPVNSYWTAARKLGEGTGDGERGGEGEGVGHPDFPEPAEQCVAIFRREYIVRRLVLSEAERAVLVCLERGGTVGESIGEAAEVFGGSDEELAVELREMFRRFTASGLFESVGW